MRKQGKYALCVHIRLQNNDIHNLHIDFLCTATLPITIRPIVICTSLLVGYSTSTYKLWGHYRNILQVSNFYLMRFVAGEVCAYKNFPRKSPMTGTCLFLIITYQRLGAIHSFLTK